MPHMLHVDGNGFASSTPTPRRGADSLERAGTGPSARNRTFGPEAGHSDPEPGRRTRTRTFGPEPLVETCPEAGAPGACSTRGVPNPRVRGAPASRGRI